MLINTERLILRPVSFSDTEDMFACCSSPNVGPNAGWKPHRSLEETRTVLMEVFVGVENVFAMEDRETGRVIGSLGLVSDDKRQFEGARMLGYSIGEAHWGKGYATEAARALISYGFSDLELEVISAYCYPGNNRSRRVIEKCGFSLEGTLRKAEKRYDGTVLDNLCFSLLKEEWSARSQEK